MVVPLETVHAHIQKFCQRGSNYDNIFFLVDEGSKYYSKRAIIGPQAKRH